MRMVSSRVFLFLVLATGAALAACSNGTDPGQGSPGGGPNPFAIGDSGTGPFSPDGGGPTADGGPGFGSDAGADVTPPAPADAGPSDAGPPPKDSAPPVDAAPPQDSGAASFDQHNLDVINQYRAGACLPPYHADSGLSQFAAAGSQELSQDHLPHQHFMNDSSQLFSQYGCTSAGENQGDPNGWPVAAEDTQIDQIMAAMYAEGPSGGHYQNMMSTTFTRVGFGLLEVNGQLYLTNDFCN